MYSNNERDSFLVTSNIYRTSNGPYAKEAKDARDAKDAREAKDPKAVKAVKDAKDAKDAKNAKDAKDATDAKDVKDAKDNAHVAGIFMRIFGLEEIEPSLHEHICSQIMKAFHFYNYREDINAEQARKVILFMEETEGAYTGDFFKVFCSWCEHLYSTFAFKNTSERVVYLCKNIKIRINKVFEWALDNIRGFVNISSYRMIYALFLFGDEGTLGLYLRRVAFRPTPRAIKTIRFAIANAMRVHGVTEYWTIERRYTGMLSLVGLQFLERYRIGRQCGYVIRYDDSKNAEHVSDSNISCYHDCSDHEHFFAIPTNEIGVNYDDYDE